MRARSSSLREALAALLCALIVSLPAQAGNLVEEFDAARPGLHRHLRSRLANERIEALRKLQRYPLADAVRMVHATFGDEDENVRHEAYAALLAMNGEQEVCATLAELATKGMKDTSGAALVPPALAALLSSNLPYAQIKAQQLLDETVGPSKQGSEIMQAMADGLAMNGRATDALTLARLSNSKRFSEDFGVRRAVVDALIKIQKKEAVATLIGLMDSVGGEARADAAQHLTKLTGQIYGLDSGAWQRWWKEAGPAFNHPAVFEEGPDRELPGEGRNGYYYGLPLQAERLVFVLDISGSMQGIRIVAAKRELIKAINGLPDKVHFGIVVFSESVNNWQRKLVLADKKMKHAAIEFVERQTPQTNTASYDALEAALTYDTEAIYFLSDGAPTSGKIVAPVDILTAVRTVNKTRRISIYTIGIAPGFPGSPTDTFLKTMSEQNRGKYRRIDE